MPAFIFLPTFVATNAKRMKKMKQTFIGFMIVVSAVVLSVSCKKEPERQIIVAKKPTAEAPRQTQRVGDYEQTMDVEWGGKPYSVFVSRKADESLPLADDGAGNKYYDNKINVKIVRSDGTTFFERTFLKSDFSQYLDEDSRRNAAILGVVFDRAEGDNVFFAASIGSPDIVGSDEYLPFVVKITKGGGMTISKDVLRDIDGSNDASSADIDEEGV